jgi:hypothetical protein
MRSLYEHLARAGQALTVEQVAEIAVDRFVRAQLGGVRAVGPRDAAAAGRRWAAPDEGLCSARGAGRSAFDRPP